MTDEYFIKLAINEAKKASKYGDVPVGAVIVKKNEVISKAYNKKEKKQSSIRHAEIEAIEKACRKLKTWHLDDCILYTNMEPCLMCAGAILQSRIKKVVYSINNPKFGYVGSIENILNLSDNNHKVEVVKGISAEESKMLITSFFQKIRNEKL